MYSQASISKGSNNTVCGESLLLQPMSCRTWESFLEVVFLSFCTLLLLVAFSYMHKDSHNTQNNLNVWSINTLKRESGDGPSFHLCHRQLCDLHQVTSVSGSPSISTINIVKKMGPHDHSVGSGRSQSSICSLHTELPALNASLST